MRTLTFVRNRVKQGALQGPQGPAAANGLLSSYEKARRSRFREMESINRVGLPNRHMSCASLPNDFNQKCLLCIVPDPEFLRENRHFPYFGQYFVCHEQVKQVNFPLTKQLPKPSDTIAVRGPAGPPTLPIEKLAGICKVLSKLNNRPPARGTIGFYRFALLKFPAAPPCFR